MPSCATRFSIPRALPPVGRVLLAWVAFGVSMSPSSAPAAPPRYDHVVIVIEENRSVTQIIGDLVNAPYINSLANAGVRLGGMYAITHPSQPNYLHLFSGGHQGVLNDNLPPNFSTTPTGTYPFKAANLGAEILAAGFTFAGYSEQIESAGAADWADYDPHTATNPGISYRRKHNPWANWIAKVLPPPAGQMTGAVNRAFTQFPTGFAPASFAALPTVSFVVPNQLHDMHDGSRKMGDDWLRDNLGAYATWARTNNSLLIITWDEDDYNGVNQIPTVLYGAGLRNGTVTAGTWTLHNLLRTIEDMYGSAAHAGAAAQLRSITGPFTDDPAVTNATFRQGLAGYTGAQDTQIGAETPATNHAATLDLTADLDTSSSTAGNQEAQVLVRFDSLFGSAAGQVPTNAIIHSAKLLLRTPVNTTGTSYDSADTFRAHRMIIDWNDTATWNSLGGGVSANDVESASAPTFSLVPSVDGAPAIYDVTSDIELFQAGTPNRGWVIRPSSSGTSDGWTLKSGETTSDQTLRPILEIIYSITTPYHAWATAQGLSGVNRAPLDDPDFDGASNLDEFSSNLNPLVADARPVSPTGTNGLPAARYLAGVSDGVLEMDFLRRKGATALGLSYVPQFSGHLLGTWVSGQTTNVTPLNAEWERVTVRDSVAGPNSQRFGKVAVTLQP